MIEIDFLQDLDRFTLALKKHSIEHQEGEQASTGIGQGMIFEDHKKYVPGDDIRKMDWKAYARTGEYFIKRFEEEKSVTIHILLDRSTSMEYGDPKKYDYAAKIGLGLAYMAANTNDRFRFSVFSETVTDITAARRNANLPELVDILNNLPRTPESKVERCLTAYGDRIKNKSIVVVISDFLVPIDEVDRGVSRLRGSDVVLVNVLDQSELSPEFSGDTILKDPESDASRRTYLSRRIKTDYQSKLEEHLSQLEITAHKNQAEFVNVSTKNDFFDTFLAVWNRLNR